MVNLCEECLFQSLDLWVQTGIWLYLTQRMEQSSLFLYSSFFLEALELFVIVSVQKIVLLWQCHTFFLLLLFLLSLWPASLVPCSKAVPFPHAFHNILLNVSPSLKPFPPLYGIFSSFLNYIHTQNHTDIKTKF